MHILRVVLFFIIFAIHAVAEPYLSPQDPFIRHEIRLLGDSGELTGLQNTWPLDLGGLSGMRTNSSFELPHALLDDRISLESASGWSPLKTTLGLTDDRVTARVLALNPVRVLPPMHRFPG